MGNQEIIGFVAAGVAVLFFGSNFVPVKKYETGNGLFFQWILCTSIWMTGLIVNLIKTSFTDGLVTTINFYPFAMLGGALWVIGNVMVVPIIKSIGMALGMCIWGTANLLVGWASGTFGLFDLTKETVPKPTYNYIGVSFAVISVMMFVFIKSNTGEENQNNLTEVEALLNDSREIVERSWIEKLPPTRKRIFGCVMSVISGIFYGVNFDPPQYLMDHHASANGLDYVFSHFSGIFAMSTVLMLIYCIVSKNKPALYPQIVLPGMISGVMWAIAQTCWFIANEKLEMVVAFPIISTVPALVASFWGVIVFKEIQGTRNYIFLGLAFLCIFVAVTLITLSKLQ